MDWARGEELVRHACPSATAFSEGFTGVRDYVRARGLNGADHPFPHYLREWLLALVMGSQLSQTLGAVHGAGEACPAAEYGRRDL